MEYAASRISKSSLSQYRYTPHFVRSTLLYVSKSHDIDFKFIISFQLPKGRQGNTPPATRYRQFPASGEEILFLIRKIILRAGLAAQRLTVMDLLQVIQAAGNPFIAIGIEGIKVDARPAIHPAVNLGSIQDRLAIRIHNARSRGAVGIDEIGICVGFIVRAFRIPVTERRL